MLPGNAPYRITLALAACCCGCSAVALQHAWGERPAGVVAAVPVDPFSKAPLRPRLFRTDATTPATVSHAQPAPPPAAAETRPQTPLVGVVSVQSTASSEAAEPAAEGARQAAATGAGEKPVAVITLDLSPPAGSVPQNAAQIRYATDQPVAPEAYRSWDEAVYFWESPVFCHGPLYFEDRRLERDGLARRPRLRPLTSGAHFFTSALSLPYQMTVHPPRACYPTRSHQQSHALGYPPLPATPQRHLAGVAAQTATVAGLILLIP